MDFYQSFISENNWWMGEYDHLMEEDFRYRSKDKGAYLSARPTTDHNYLRSFREKLMWMFIKISCSLQDFIHKCI